MRYRPERGATFARVNTYGTDCGQPVAGSWRTTLDAPRIGKSFLADLYDPAFGQKWPLQKKNRTLALSTTLIGLGFPSNFTASGPGPK